MGAVIILAGALGLLCLGCLMEWVAERLAPTPRFDRDDTDGGQ